MWKSGPRVGSFFLSSQTIWMKIVLLWGEYIEKYTDKGDYILDPFVGSGMTYFESVKRNRIPITIDLNPLSRTSQTSDISIVDNVVRAFPFMTEIAKDLKTQDKQLLINMINDFDNRKNLKEALKLFKNK